ncbi:hypothetical protein AAD018_008000 [Aestuariibius insulae]|uniref:hypothetical protein n=1 Tax=Aestuariibius insulae TaxID=2058287 RepID=UPI00345EB94E
MSSVFEERFVIFIDILGFADMISEAKRSPAGEMAERVDKALTRIENMGLHGPDRVCPEPSIDGYHSHIFSDCIVISVSPEPSAVSKLTIELAKLTLSLMEIGVWIRGGMSHGQISRKKTAPWGPAIVEAYEVESKLAVFPRIALSESAVQFFDQSAESSKEDRFLIRDSDGVWSLAPFIWAAHDSKTERPFLTEVRAKNIKEKLEEAHRRIVDKPAVFRKIDWLIEKWDWHLKPEGGVPAFDCRTEIGKKHDLVRIFNEALDD